MNIRNYKHLLYTANKQFPEMLIESKLSLQHTLYVTGFCKINKIVTLGCFHFIGPANGYSCTLYIHGVINRLSLLVYFSRASFANAVNL